MKIIIEVHLPKNASETGKKLFKDGISDELRRLLIAIGNATVPESEARDGDTHVEVMLK